MSKLVDLKAADSLKTFAPVLGLPASALAYTLYIAPGPKYKKFTVPKKSGGVREIAAPTKRLKSVQNYLSNVLSECRLEIEATLPPRKLVSHAFRKEGSIITNAQQHTGRRYVLNLDLEDFFPSFNFGRVRGFFIANKNFALHAKVATIIAQIACHDNALPQGSPCSPIISDLIAHILDMQLIQFVKKHKCTYSRYVDDITISTNQKSFPKAIADQLAPNDSAWVLGDPLLHVINNAGFSINHKKNAHAISRGSASCDRSFGEQKSKH